MTLTKFLLARIAEDEAAGTRLVLREMLSCPVCGESVVDYVTPATINGRRSDRPDRCEPCGHELTEEQAAACWLPATSARVLAECEAKRQIVDFASRAGDLYESDASDEAFVEWRAFNHALKALALPYADHPDYDESWLRRCVNAKSATDRALPPEQVATLSALVRDALYLWSSEKTKMLSGVAEQVTKHIAPTIAEWLGDDAVGDR